MQFTRPDGLPLLIAEIGFNHAGDMELAQKMIVAAAAAGADMVKFQTFRAEDLALPHSLHFELIRKGEMGLENMRVLSSVAKEHGVTFFSTPFSSEAVDKLESLEVDCYKVASMDVTNRHLLARLAATGRPLMLSTGMATLDEIGETLAFLEKAKAGPVALMHCISHYPPQASDLNLAAIGHLQRTFQVPVGYSDHYPGTDACLAAFFQGAQIIETHFTLDHTIEGGDHAHSTEPDMLRRLLNQMRLFRAMAGSENVYDQRPDRPEAALYRRGVYTARALPKGHVPSESDLLFCRPPSPLTPNDFEWISKSPLEHDVPAHTALTRNDFTHAH